MSDAKVVKSLAKVMIAAAWVDGEISLDEKNSLKDLLFMLPDMTAANWAELEIYIETPINDAERKRLLEELKRDLRNDRHKKLVQESITAVIHADGVLSDHEEAVLAEVGQMLDEIDGSVIGQMGQIVRSAMGRRSKAVANAPNREKQLFDFVHNRVFYLVRERMGREDIEFDLSEAQLRKLSLAGALLGRVAYADRHVDETEITAIGDVLKDKWSLKPEQAVLVAEVSASAASRGLDYYRVMRGFYDATTEQERTQFLHALFAVARAHDDVSNEEIENIRSIATFLKLDHRDFIDAKLQIPRDERGGL